MKFPGKISQMRFQPDFPLFDVKDRKNKRIKRTREFLVYPCRNRLSISFFLFVFDEADFVRSPGES